MRTAAPPTAKNTTHPQRAVGVAARENSVEPSVRLERVAWNVEQGAVERRGDRELALLRLLLLRGSAAVEAGEGGEGFRVGGDVAKGGALERHAQLCDEWVREKQKEGGGSAISGAHSSFLMQQLRRPGTTQAAQDATAKKQLR